MRSLDTRELRSKLLCIVDRLRALGYVFEYPADVLPGPVEPAEIEEFERLVGPLPELLRSFYLTVGSVSLMGQHPDWQYDSFPDPLYVSDFGYILSRAEEYTRDPETRAWFQGSYGSFIVELSPDAYHKAGVSGGECYHVRLPAEPDPLVLGMLSGPSRLSAYLAEAIEWGGFPGLAGCAHDWPLEEIRSLTGGGTTQSPSGS